jgi:hypothetical protein
MGCVVWGCVGMGITATSFGQRFGGAAVFCVMVFAANPRAAHLFFPKDRKDRKKIKELPASAQAKNHATKNSGSNFT